MPILSPKPIQIPAIDFMLEHPRCAIWAGMGTGKTSGALLVAHSLPLIAGVRGPTLVIGPLRVARDVWPAEAAKWAQFADLKIVPVIGTPAQRLKALARKADIYTTNYETLPWLVAHYMEKWPFRQVIADESSRLKGFRMSQGGFRAKQIGRVAHTLVDRWINLTGTPAPNGLQDLWGQTWFLDRGQRLGRTYTAFAERWFVPNFSGYGMRALPGADEQIHQLLGDICLTLDPRDYFDLKEPIISTITVQMPPAAKAAYRQLERTLFAELENGETLEVFNEAALTNKCLQFANGAVYTQHPAWAPVHSAKLEALESIIAEGCGPILVSYEFRSDLQRLRTHFPRAVELATRAGMDAFRAGDAPIGLAHPASLGHGIDGLQEVCNTLVRFGRNWNLEQHQQMLERIGPMRQLQAGLDRPVYVYDIVTEGTLDMEVVERMQSKCTVQDALLNAMKRRR